MNRLLQLSFTLSEDEREGVIGPCHIVGIYRHDVRVPKMSQEKGLLKLRELLGRTYISKNMY